MIKHNEINNVSAVFGKCVDLGDNTLQKLINKSFVHYENNIAIQTSTKGISYGDLKKYVIYISSFLTNSRLNDRCAIILKKSWIQIVSVLGVLYSGETYVPMDYNLPDKRINDCLLQVNTKYIISDTEKLKKLDIPKNVIVINVDELDWEVKNIEDNFEQQDQSEVAIIFTSGSTGIPKGVILSHESIVNCVLFTNQYFKLSSSDKLFNISNLCHDMSIYDIFGTFSVGATLVIPDEDNILEPEHWIQLINRYKVTVWISVPTLWNILLTNVEINKNVELDSLRIVLLGGEKVSTQLCLRSKGVYAKDLYSCGGPTETTMWNIIHCITDDDIASGVIPYGNPIWNTNYYICDKNDNIVIRGRKGTIVNSGLCVSKGYINAYDNKNLFYYSEKLGQQVYRTGDTGVVRNDDIIEIHGRMDNQIKIQGKRIEIEEIESILCTHEHIQAATVIVNREKEMSKLIAFIIKSHKKEHMIDTWSYIFDEAYRSNGYVEEQDDFTGWISSYTSQPIPKEEMIEWRDQTVERIKALKGKKILEIGCGTGLLLFQLAPEASEYIGIDISQVAIEKLEQKINNNVKFNNTKVFVGSADDLSAVKNHTFDVIIINSVILFFPSYEYCTSVLKNCYELLSKQGALFVGDVRDYALLELFKMSVIRYQKPTISEYNLKKEIVKASAREKELLYAQQYFLEVGSQIGFEGVTIKAKAGTYSNELNKYRYDVILYKTKHIEDNILISYIYNESKFSLEKLRNQLSILQEKEVLEWTDIPNQELAQEAVLLDKIKQNNLAKYVNINKDDNTIYKTYYTPADIYNLASQIKIDCSVRVYPNGKMSAYFSKGTIYSKEEVNHSEMRTSFTNEPFVIDSEEIMLNDIKEFAMNSLPLYMIPHEWVFINRFPLLNNGKINRNRLKTMIPHDLVVENTLTGDAIMDYVMNIWKTTLNIKKLEENDNFYRVGGHSLLAMQMISTVNKQRKLTIKLSDFMKNPTVKNMVSIIKRSDSKKEEGVY